MVRRRIGDAVKAGDTLAELHLAKPDAAVAARVRGCFVIGDAPVSAPALIVDRID